MFNVVIRKELRTETVLLIAARLVAAAVINAIISSLNGHNQLLNILSPVDNTHENERLFRMHRLLSPTATYALVFFHTTIVAYGFFALNAFRSTTVKRGICLAAVLSFGSIAFQANQIRIGELPYTAFASGYVHSFLVHTSTMLVVNSLFW